MFSKSEGCGRSSLSMCLTSWLLIVDKFHEQVHSLPLISWQVLGAFSTILNKRNVELKTKYNKTVIYVSWRRDYFNLLLKCLRYLLLLENTIDILQFVSVISSCVTCHWKMSFNYFIKFLRTLLWPMLTFFLSALQLPISVWNLWLCQGLSHSCSVCYVGLWI